MHSTSITAKECKAGDEPLLKKLSSAYVQQQTSQQLVSLLHDLRLDAALPVMETIEGLLTTEATIIIRFEEFARFPYSIWRLSRRHRERRGLGFSGW